MAENKSFTIKWLRISLLVALPICGYAFRDSIMKMLGLFCQRSVQSFMGDLCAANFPSLRIMLHSFMHNIIFFWLPPRQVVAAVGCAGYPKGIIFSLVGSMGAGLIVYGLLYFLLHDVSSPLRDTWNKWQSTRKVLFLSSWGLFWPGCPLLICVWAAITGAKTVYVALVLIFTQLPFLILYTSHATIYHSLVPTWLVWGLRLIGLFFLGIALFIKRD